MTQPIDNVILSRVKRRIAEEAEECWDDLGRVWNQEGWAWFETPQRPFNVNLFGLRNPHQGIGITGVFNDLLCLAYHDEKGVPTLDTYSATTEPGRPHMIRPVHRNGSGAIARGQYRGAYEPGPFKGWQVLRQHGRVLVHRDGNRNGIYEWHDHTEAGWGFFIHPRSKRAERINKHIVGGSSAGCLVTEHWEDWIEFWEIIAAAEEEWGSSFSLTMLGMEELNTDLWNSHRGVQI